MKKKKLIQYSKIIVLTAILFFAGLYFVTRLVTPYGQIESFYDEPKDSIDVLVVGGSHAMCSISPIEIYDDTGLTTYNLATWSQPVWVSYHYIKEALKYQQPEVVILDVFGSFYDRSYLTGVDVDLVSDDYAQLMRPSLNLLELNFARFRTQVTRKSWSEYLNIAKYHSRLIELTAEDFEKIFTDDSTTAKGYGPFYTIESFADYQYPQTDKTADLYPYAQEYLLRIIELLKSEGIRPVLVKIPHIADENDMMLINTIEQIAEEQQVDFLDFCTGNPLNMDFAQDFSDHGHVNNYGAKKVTAAVSDYLAGLQLSPEHSEKITERWQQASLIENAQMQQMEVKLSRTLAELVERAGTLNSALIFAKRDTGNLADADYSRLETLLAEAGITEMAQQIRDEDLFVYTQEELLTGEEARAWCEERGITLTGENTGEIFEGQENCSYLREGLNAAVYDLAEGKIYHYCSVAKEHDYTPYTK